MDLLVIVSFVIGGYSFNGADIVVFNCCHFLNCNSGLFLQCFFIGDYFVVGDYFVCTSVSIVFERESFSEHPEPVRMCKCLVRAYFTAYRSFSQLSCLSFKLWFSFLEEYELDQGSCRCDVQRATSVNVRLKRLW